MFAKIYAELALSDAQVVASLGVNPKILRGSATLRAALKALEAWPFSQHATERTARRTCWVHVDPRGDCDCGAAEANAARDAAHAAVVAAWESK